MVKRIYNNGDCIVDFSEFKDIIDSSNSLKVVFFVNSQSVNVTKETIEDYTINLNWNELQPLGRGMLQYILYYGESDTAFTDGEYNKTDIRTTEYYIMSDIEIVDDLPINIEMSEYLEEKIEKADNTLMWEIPITEANIGETDVDPITLSQTIKLINLDIDYSLEEFLEALRSKKLFIINIIMQSPYDRSILAFSVDKSQTEYDLSENKVSTYCHLINVHQRLTEVFSFKLIYNNGFAKNITIQSDILATYENIANLENEIQELGTKELTRLVDGEGENSIKMKHLYNETLASNDFAYGRGAYLSGANSLTLVGGISGVYLTGSNGAYKLTFNSSGANPARTADFYNMNLCANLLVGAKLWNTDLKTYRATITAATADTANTQVINITTDVDLGTLNKTQLTFTSNRSTGKNTLQSGPNTLSSGDYNTLLGSINVSKCSYSSLIGRANRCTSNYSTVLGYGNDCINTSSNSPSILLGMANTSKAQSVINGFLNDAEHSSILVGTNLKTYAAPEYTDVYPTVVGTYNGEYDNKARFIVGGGHSESTRQNLITVNSDGTVLDVNGKKFVTEDVVEELISRIEALENRA